MIVELQQSGDGYNCRVQVWDTSNATDYSDRWINKISSIFKHSLWQRNLSTIQQNYINKLIKLRSEVSNW